MSMKVAQESQMAESDPKYLGTKTSQAVKLSDRRWQAIVRFIVVPNAH